MGRFCDFGIDADVIVGKDIELNDLFGQRILVEKIRIMPTKYPGKNASGKCMQMQIVLARFNETADADGDYFEKDKEGRAIGERRSCFTGSDSLMKQIERAESSLPGINEKRVKDGLKPVKVFPMDTIPSKVGKCFLFT